MSGVELKTFAEYQQAISKLAEDPKKNGKEINRLLKEMNSVFFSGDGKTVTAGQSTVSTKVGDKVEVNANIAGEEEIAAQKKYTDRDNVRNEFGSKLTDAEWETLEKEYEAAKKVVKDLDKDLKKSKPSDGGYEKKLADFNDAQVKLAEVTQKYDKEKIRRDISNGRGDDGIMKAAKRNVKNFTNVDNRQHVFLSKEDEEMAIGKDPALDGHTAVLKHDDQVALSKISAYAQYKLNKAKEGGQEKEIAAAQEKWGDYADIYPQKVDADGKPVVDKDGNPVKDYTKPDVRKAQNVLVDESGFDERFNIDELETMSKMYRVSKGDVKGVVKKFGFGVESGVAQKFKAAGIAATSALLGNLIPVLSGDLKKVTPGQTAQGKPGETVQQTVIWQASSGEVFKHTFEATGGAGGIAKTADAIAKLNPALALTAGPVTAGIAAFLFTKARPEDAFGGKRVDAVLEDINLVKGKDNKAIVNNIQDMTITGDKQTDKLIKAAVLEAALGENTNAANTEELLAAYESLKNTKDMIGKMEVKPSEPPAPPVTPPTTPPTPPVTPPKPEYPELDVIEEKVDVRTELPRLKYREGTWYTSHAYVNEDGSNLTEAERKQVQKELRKSENKIALVDTNGDGKATFRDKKVSLPTIIELPSGKKVKVADDAYKRIMSLDAGPGGKNGAYGIHRGADSKFYVVDNKGKKVSQGYDTLAEAKAEEARLEAIPIEKKAEETE